MTGGVLSVVTVLVATEEFPAPSNALASTVYGPPRTSLTVATRMSRSLISLSIGAKKSPERSNRDRG